MLAAALQKSIARTVLSQEACRDPHCECLRCRLQRYATRALSKQFDAILQKSGEPMPSLKVEAMR